MRAEPKPRYGACVCPNALGSDILRPAVEAQRSCWGWLLELKALCAVH